MEIINENRDKKILGGCDDALLSYSVPKFSTVYVVKPPVPGLQRAFFSGKLGIFSKVKMSSTPLGQVYKS